MNKIFSILSDWSDKLFSTLLERKTRRMEELDKIATAVDEHYKPEKTLTQKINELSEDKLLDIEFGENRDTLYRFNPPLIMNDAHQWKTKAEMYRAKYPVRIRPYIKIKQMEIVQKRWKQRESNPSCPPATEREEELAIRNERERKRIDESNNAIIAGGLGLPAVIIATDDSNFNRSSDSCDSSSSSSDSYDSGSCDSSSND